MINQHTRRGNTQTIKNVSIKNKVILNLLQDLQRLSLLFMNNMRGRWQIKSAMTPLFDNDRYVEDPRGLWTAKSGMTPNKITARGFTLIELLVVVLIIGILAAIALPQYQRVVLKSRFIQLMTIGDAISSAEEIYYLEHGEYTDDLTKLDITVDSDNPQYVVTLGIDNVYEGHSLVEVSDSMYPAFRYWHYLKHHSSEGVISEKADRRLCHVSGEKGTVNLEETVCQNIASTKTPIHNYSIYRDYLL